MMQLPSLSVRPAGALSLGAGDLVLAAAFEGEAPATTDLPQPLAAAFARLAARPGWRGTDGQRLATEAGDGGPEVALYGLGKRPASDPAYALRKLDNWMREALDCAAGNRVATAAVLLPSHPLLDADGDALVTWLGRALVRATYRFDRLRSEPFNGHRLDAVQVVPAAPTTSPAGLLDAVSRGVAFCRDLGNTPGNEATPAWMDDRAREMAGELGMEHLSLGPDELRRRGMGGILAVGSGSGNEPRLVRLEWGTGGPVVALVGKGVTFDTGGISIKPSKDMDEMKYDKCGACAVLGIARTVAELELPVRLRAYVPLAENMPGGRSYRPGDIVRTYSGKTVEILNTDAEGRMILADALALASEEEPDLLLEYSTLTGAAVVALGQEAASLYSPDDEMAGGLLESAGRTGERLWRMPLWPEFVERMKGTHGDLKNLGGRWGGANTAAAFLSRFVGDLPRWAHMDIAGGAYVGRDADEDPGATGYGVALTVDWLRRRLL